MLPTFMPVATQAAIKGLTPQQVEALGITLILNNTYHLNLRPGIEVLDAAGGAHKFQGWKRNLLTDSGGFQLVSLSRFTKITEEGALFASPFDGEMTMLSARDALASLLCIKCWKLIFDPLFSFLVFLFFVTCSRNGVWRFSILSGRILSCS